MERGDAAPSRARIVPSIVALARVSIVRSMQLQIEGDSDSSRHFTSKPRVVCHHEITRWPSRAALHGSVVVVYGSYSCVVFLVQEYANFVGRFQ